MLFKRLKDRIHYYKNPKDYKKNHNFLGNLKKKIDLNLEKAIEKHEKKTAFIKELKKCGLEFY